MIIPAMVTKQVRVLQLGELLLQYKSTLNLRPWFLALRGWTTLL